MNKLVIKKSNRKTFSIEINDREEIIVKVPFWANQKQIDKLLEDKSLWINKKLNEIKTINSFKKNRKYSEGEIFLCAGEKYLLKFKNNAKYVLFTNDNQIIIDKIYQDDAPKLIEKWYKHQARTIILPRAIEIAKSLNIEVKQIKLSNARKRFGSCSSKGNINLSWRLVIAHKDIIDYVIVHELAHLFEMNHSKKFWQIVEKILPNYREQEKWLKVNVHILNI